MEPVLLKLQLAPAAIRRQRRKVAPLGKTLWKTRVQLRRNLAASALRPKHTGDRDEAARYSTISN
jgi:hypothetical protein